MRALPLSACLLLCAASLQAQATSTMHAQTASAGHSPKHALSWGPAPAVFPQGAKMAVVKGDPSKAGLFTVELSFPDGYKIPPHFHPTAETVRVKKGTFLVGMGDSLNLAKAKAMKPGAKGTLPAEQHHYAAAKGATVVSVTSKGPFAMTYVNPADDPQKANQ
jgi:quercetin dioxygenase-like cupin family protein